MLFVLCALMMMQTSAPEGFILRSHLCIFMCPFKDPSVEKTLVASIWFSSIKVLLGSRRANKIMYGLLVTFLKVQGHFLEPLRQKVTRHHAMWGPSGNRTQLVKSINKWGGDHFGNYHWLLLRRYTLTGDVFSIRKYFANRIQDANLDMVSGSRIRFIAHKSWKERRTTLIEKVGAPSQPKFSEQSTWGPIQGVGSSLLGV